MDPMVKASLWHQFGASIDMLNDALRLCPDELWTGQLWKDPEDDQYGQFWFIAYHTLSWTDVFLTSANRKDFVPPPPFVKGRLPDKPYTREEIQTYLEHCRAKGQATIEGLTDEKADEMQTFGWGENIRFFELQMYSMRHIQEHGAQLNLFLGQKDIEGQDWVTTAREITVKE
jgi:hypothetical protein